ncbi:MAG: hypothetical protein HY231_06500 [Acidobacteria bacterium]|nr:hypothetical protein [Acidobacteriota bacterium]
MDFAPTFYAPAPDSQEAIADVEFNIEEGKRYSINKIIISADESLNEQEICTRLVLREGEVFKQSRFEQSLEQVNQFLTRFGVYEKLWESDVEINTNEAMAQVDFTFKIKKKFH